MTIKEKIWTGKVKLNNNFCSTQINCFFLEKVMVNLIKDKQSFLPGLAFLWPQFVPKSLFFTLKKSVNKKYFIFTLFYFLFRLFFRSIEAGHVEAAEAV